MRIRHLALPLAILSLTLFGSSQTPAEVSAVTFIHSACASGCPAFSLRIEKSGIVSYDGKGSVKVFGQKTWSVPEKSAEDILERLQTGGFVAGERGGKFLTDEGQCATKPTEKQGAVVVEASGREEMPIPSCFSPGLEKIVEDASLLTSVSIYAEGRDEVREAAIRAVLDSQVAAWNKGDIDGFMRGYWMSKDLTFFSGGSETHGWSETLARYRKSYQGTGKQMGQLTFGDLRIEILSPDAAFVRGTWKLTMSDGKTPNGLFTLIFRKMPDGWRIIHDSTGAA